MEWCDEQYFSVCRARPTISTQLIDRGQSKDKRMASWKVYVFPNWDSTHICWQNKTFKSYCNFLMEISKAFYQQEGFRFLLAWTEGTFEVSSPHLCTLTFCSSQPIFSNLLLRTSEMLYPKKEGKSKQTAIMYIGIFFFLNGNILSLEKGPREPIYPQHDKNSTFDVCWILPCPTEL